MIEQLSQLLQDASINRLQLNLTVKPDSDHVIVTINTFTGSTNTDSVEVNRLREALSRPIIVRGDKGEVDVELITVLHQYTDAHANAVAAYHNHANTISGLEQSTRVAEATKPKTAKAGVPTKAVSKTTETPPETASETLSQDMFETDDIDSL